MAYKDGIGEVKSQGPLHIERICAGYYRIKKAGKYGRIFRLDEGNYKGFWVIDWEHDGSYSDPIFTYREAKQFARNWEV